MTPVTSRRLALGGLAAVAFVPVACSTWTDPLEPQDSDKLRRLIAGAQTIEQSLVSSVPLLLSAVKVSQEDVANVRIALSALVTATNALALAPTLQAGTPQVQAIETALNTIVTVASGLPVIPEPYHTTLVVAALALPPIEALAGLALRDGTALAATIRAGKIARP